MIGWILFAGLLGIVIGFLLGAWVFQEDARKMRKEIAKLKGEEL